MLAQVSVHTSISIYHLNADPTHTDAMNNIGAVLSALPLPDRKRVAGSLGLFPPPPEKNESTGQSSSSETMDMDIGALDQMVEGFFRRTLEVESSHRWALNNLGLHLHAHGRNNEVRWSRSSFVQGVGSQRSVFFLRLIYYTTDI